MSTILLIEDNEITRDILSRRLRKIGYEVMLAADGGAGIALAASHHPDLILMDMSLPGMDGCETTRELRNRRDTTEIPVIAVTAHTLARDRARAIQAGCDDFETKPVELPQLVHKIEMLLSRKSSVSTERG